MDKFSENLPPNLKPLVTSKNWKDRQSSLENLLKLIESSDFKPSRTLVDLVIHALKNEKHGNLALTVIKIFDSFTQILIKNDISFFEKHYKRSLPDFLSRFCENKSNILIPLHSAVTSFNLHCNFDFVVNTYASQLFEVKKPTIRCQLVKSLLSYFDAISGKQNKLDHSKFIKNVKAICSQLASSLNDQFAETRESSLKCLAYLRSFAIDDKIFDKAHLHSNGIKNNFIEKIQNIAVELASSVPIGRDTTYEKEPTIIEPVAVSTLMKRPKAQADLFDEIASTPLPKRSPLNQEVHSIIKVSELPVSNLTKKPVQENLANFTIPENFESILQIGEEEPSRNEVVIVQKKIESNPTIEMESDKSPIPLNPPATQTSPLHKEVNSHTHSIHQDQEFEFNEKNRLDFETKVLEINCYKSRCYLFTNLVAHMDSINQILTVNSSPSFLQDNGLLNKFINDLCDLILHSADHIFNFTLLKDKCPKKDTGVVGCYVKICHQSCQLLITIIKSDLISLDHVQNVINTLVNLFSVIRYFYSQFAYVESLISDEDYSLFENFVKHDVENLLRMNFEENTFKFTPRLQSGALSLQDYIIQVVEEIFAFCLRKYSMDDSIDHFFDFLDNCCQYYSSFIDTYLASKNTKKACPYISLPSSKICNLKSVFCMILCPATSLLVFNPIFERIEDYVEANTDRDFFKLSQRCLEFFRQAKYIDQSTRTQIFAIYHRIGTQRFQSIFES